MPLHLEPTPDDPSLQAVMYGPLVLAGKLGSAGLTPAVLRAEPTQPRHIPEYKSDPVAVPAFRAPSTEPATWIAAGATPLTFHTTGQTQNVEFIPFYKIFDERYAIYWKVT